MKRMIDFLSAIVLAGVILGIWLQHRPKNAAAQTHREEQCIWIHHPLTPHNILAETHCSSTPTKAA
jgi:hypothetical protein